MKRQRLKIIADDKIPFLKGVMEPYADITYLSGGKIAPKDVREADALFTRTRTKCNEALLKNSRVKLIVTATIGFDHIDTEYCEKAGIHWMNAPGCNSWSVYQYITAAIITFVYERNLEFSNLTLGIIGAGNVGTKVEQAAKVLGMKILINDPPRVESEGEEGFSELTTLLAKSDIVTCHTPLTKEGPYPTYHLASYDFFKRMKKDALFINSSRGGVTNSEALKEAAKTKLSGYVLDVWEGEPFPDINLLNSSFIGTPHIAGYSSDGKANGTAVCIKEFCRFFELDVLQEWYPESIPQPPMDTVFSVNGTRKKKEHILYDAVTHTYPIWVDSNRLKQSPASFEKLRGEYWIRRELKNFIIKPKNIDKETTQTLKQLGFNIDSTY